MSTLNIALFIEDRKDIHILFPFVFSPGTLTKPQCLELPISRTNFNVPKGVRAIEVRLYFI